MVRIAIAGILGRMGSLVKQLAEQDPEIEISGGIDRPGNPQVPSDLGPIIDKTDVIIDFTTPESTLRLVETARKHKKPIIVCTTGLNKEQLATIEKASKEIPCLIAPNMSQGMNVMFNIAEQITEKLPDYDIEITESHHKHKKDAPSGSAKKIAEHICKAAKVSLDEKVIYGRKGILEERPLGQIGIHSIRAGDIVGEHTVVWAGPGEVIELTHRALSRATFAGGALKAAKFIAGAKPGKYGMNDVLNIK